MKSSHRSIVPRLERRSLLLAVVLIIAFSCVLLALTLIFGQEVHRVSPGAFVGIMTSMVLCIMTGVLTVHTSGPLGRSSCEDNDRAAALSKDSFLFCLGLLAALNCLGQPILLIVSHWQDWQTAHSAIVALSALILNATLLGTLPTLYASWNLPPLPDRLLKGIP